MKQFFKFMFASMAGFVLAGVILIIVFFSVLFAKIASLSKEEEVKVKANTVLRLELNGYIAERTSENPFESISFPNFEPNKKVGVIDLIRSIDKAKNDPHITGIYMHFSPDFMVGYATLEDLRNHIIEFKKSGKFVFAYSEIYTERNYYLASAADKVYMNPSGELIFNGMASVVTFFKGSLEKLGIEMQVFRVGKFKGAVEPFMLDKLSDENRAQIDAYLESLYVTYTEGIGKTRGLPAERVREIGDKMLVRSANDAKELKMVDDLLFYDQVLAEIRKKVDAESDDKINFIIPIKYRKAEIEDEKKEKAQGKIAVIYADGDIVDGKGDAETVGSEDMIEAITKARKNDKIKAVVLRINSPGGSALASDVIWRELILLKSAKPVIVSMGDVAASGGYYIAMASDTIVAEPNTITGSIGVFGLVPNMQKLLNDKLGITMDAVKKGEFSDMGRGDRPLNQAEKDIIQHYVNDVYAQFLMRVGEARHMDTIKVSEIAQGRVWTAKDAKKIGLVDVLGGFEDAVKIAANRAGLSTYDITELPVQKNPIEEFFKGMSAETKAKMLQEELGESYNYYKQIRRVTRQQGVLVRMPFEVTIE